MMKNGCGFILAVLWLGCVGLAQQSASPRDQLNQYVGDLQKNPADDALREKIIKLTLELKPPPAIPEEANRHYVKGGIFTKEAKEKADFELAVKEYRQAVQIAPWWGDAYYNLGVALESAQDFDGAAKQFKFYLLTNPGEKDASEAHERIYAIEARKELAAKRAAEEETAAATQQAAAARKAEAKENQRRAEKEKWAWLVGKWNITRYMEGDGWSRVGIIEFEKSDNAVIGNWAMFGPPRPWVRFSWSENGTSRWENLIMHCCSDYTWTPINVTSSKDRISWIWPAQHCRDRNCDGPYMEWSLSK